MTQVKRIHTYFILEIQHEGIEYHIMISEDLKDIFDIDVVGKDSSQLVPLEETALREVIWGAFMSPEGIINLEG